MISTSTAFSTATTATIRKPKARVDIVWSALEIDPAIKVSSSHVNRAANIDQIVDGNKRIVKKWGHLKESPTGTSVIKADGTWIPMPTPTPPEAPDNRITPSNLVLDQVGWWSETASDVSSNFSVAQVLTVEFDARPITSLYVSGDSHDATPLSGGYVDGTGQYPVDFTITLTSASEGDITITVTGNDNAEYSNTAIAEEYYIDITKMVLSITKWSDPYCVVKIAEFYTTFEQSFDGDTIKSLSILEERVIGDGTLPVGNISSNVIDLSLQNIKVNGIIDPFFPSNPNSIYQNVLIKNRKITPYLGFELSGGSIEWVKMGTYWTGDWKADDNSTTASVQARDRMELLRLAEYPGSDIYEDTTLYDILEDVLDHSIANVFNMSDLTYTIDTELQDYTVPWAYLPKASYFKTIKKIVEACMAVAYMSREDVLIIEGPSKLTEADTYVLEITSNDYFNRLQPQKSEELKNRVEITTQPLVPASVPEVIYKTGSKNKLLMNSLGTQNTTIQYKKKPVYSSGLGTVDVVVDGGFTCTVATFYATHADLTITGPAGTSTSIEIEGTPLVIEGEEVVVSEDTSSIATNGLQTYAYPKNDLIQSRDMADDISEVLLPSYKMPRKDASVDWRGNPALELGDVIRLPEYIRGSTIIKGFFKVTKNKFNFDGTLKMSTEARKVLGTPIGSMQDTDGSSYVLQDTDDADPILIYQG